MNIIEARRLRKADAVKVASWIGGRRPASGHESDGTVAHSVDGSFWRDVSIERYIKDERDVRSADDRALLAFERELSAIAAHPAHSWPRRLGKRFMRRIIEERPRFEVDGRNVQRVMHCEVDVILMDKQWMGRSKPPHRLSELEVGSLDRYEEVPRQRMMVPAGRKLPYPTYWAEDEPVYLETEIRSTQLQRSPYRVITEREADERYTSELINEHEHFTKQRERLEDWGIVCLQLGSDGPLLAMRKPWSVGWSFSTGIEHGQHHAFLGAAMTCLDEAQRWMADGA